MKLSDLGMKLRKRRQELNLSINELVKLSGVSKGYISQIENGQFIPSVEILSKLADPLNIHVIDLMRTAGHIPEDVYNNHWDSSAAVFESDVHIRDSLKRLVEIDAARSMLLKELNENNTKDKQAEIESMLLKSNKEISEIYTHIINTMKERIDREEILDNALLKMKRYIQVEDNEERNKILEEINTSEQNLYEVFSDYFQKRINRIIQGRLNPINLMTPEEQEAIARQGQDYVEHLEYTHYELTNYPDIKRLLENDYPLINEIYYDKKKLDKEHIELFIKVLDGLTRDLEVNYPSDEKITKDIKLFHNIANVLNKHSDKNN